ncbi:MAG: riboflavin synthase [Vampirovibrionales bacterium]|nr:riboflavin synthase [Vampirovibrionales bacterium]
MFTGLIEAIGHIHTVSQSTEGSRITIRVPDAAFLAEARLGDSIAIDGACTTVVSLDEIEGETAFSIEASPETLSKTTFRYYEKGKRRVNLERPLTPTSRLGGHFVTGHVDGTANVLAKFREGNSWIYRFLLDDPSLAAYLIPKGSVTVNGISLTVNTVEKQAFTVAIIPHTLTHTNLGDFSPAGDDGFDTVNIECDLLGKYVHKLLGPALGHYRQGTASDAASAGKLFAGLWFNHDEAIHGHVPGSVPAETMHWPEKPIL